MYPIRSVLLIFLLWFELAQNQWLNGYMVGACLDTYSQLYTSTYEQPAYDYSQYFQVAYANPYPQVITSNYQQYPYYPYQDDSQKPIVIILENDDHDDLLEIISLIVSMKDKSDYEPIYIPYPVSGCNDYYYDFDWDCDCYSNCGCKNKGSRKSCKNDGPLCDNCCDDCECRKRGRSKSKSSSRSNSERSRCGKCDGIKHKSDCCCYY